MHFFGVNFFLQKFCSCKKNDKYEVCWIVLLFPNVSGEYQYICQCGVIDGLLPLWFPRQTRALCSQSGCCGDRAHVSSSGRISRKSPSSSHGSWAPDGVRSGIITHNRHLQSFQDCNPSVYSSGALVLLCPNPWWRIQCGPKRLGSTPFQLGAVCFDRSSLNERFQNKAAYPGGKLRAVSTTSIRGLSTNCPLKAINGS